MLTKFPDRHAGLQRHDKGRPQPRRKVYLATDQTGAVRVLPPDIGAYEYQTVASTVKALPSTESSASFTVSWSGTPGTEGYSISTYTVYVSDNGATFVPFEHQTTDTSDTFTV